jgi:hypothetical protein
MADVRPGQGRGVVQKLARTSSSKLSSGPRDFGNAELRDLALACHRNLALLFNASKVVHHSVNSDRFQVVQRALEFCMVIGKAP